MKYESNLDIYSILEHYFIASIYNKSFIQACNMWLSIWKAIQMTSIIQIT